MRYPTPALWRIRPLFAHDGDTVYAIVDRGGENKQQETWRIRLKGVFAPEISPPQEGAVECQRFVQEWLARHGDGSDWPLMLETFRTPKSDVDIYTLGRIIGVITAADAAVLNDEIQAFVTANGYPGGIGS
ncbi:hypothetical protein [Terrabacter terrigena]|uniref:Uncharacterized protein n=1 Tax=Terrabacter terrigena TaxID=574718 RepID=A0ABW3MXV0_9MICO